MLGISASAAEFVAAESIPGTGEAEAGAVEAETGTSNGYHDAECLNAEGSCHWRWS